MSLKGVLGVNTLPITNGDELNLDFVQSEGTQNLTFTQDFSPEFNRLNSKDDPIAVLENYVSAKGIVDKIQFPLIVNDELQLNGSLYMGDSSNEFRESNPELWKVKWKAEQNVFFDRAGKLPLSEFLSSSDYDSVRYIVKAQPDFLEGGLVSLATAFVIKATIDQAKDLANAIKELDTLLTPEPEKIAPPAVNTAAPSVTRGVKNAAFNVLIQSAYTALLAVAINDLFKSISESIFQKPRQMYCLNVGKVIRKGVEHLGLEFESKLFKTYLGKNLTFLHASTTQGKLTGKPNNNPVPKITLLEFMDKFSPLFKAKAKAVSGKVIYESDQYFRDLPPLNKSLQNNYDNGSFSYNLDELNTKISVKYIKSSDTWAEDSEYQKTFSWKTGKAKDYTLGSTLEVQLPYIIARRQNNMDSVAKAFNSVFDFFTGLTSNYKVSKGDRVGYIRVSQNFIATDTVFLMDSNQKIKKDTRDILSAENIYNEFYVSEEPYNRLEKVYKGVNDAPLFSTSETLELIDNNNIKDSSGNKIRVTKHSYDQETKGSVFEYRRSVNPNELGYFNKENFKIK